MQTFMVLLLSSLALPLSSWASADQPTGKDLLHLFAYVCETESYAKLHAKAINLGFDKMAVKSASYKKVDGGLKSTDGKLWAQAKDGKVQVQVDGKTYVGTDVCAATLAFMSGQSKKSANLWNAILPQAFAQEDLLPSRNSLGEKLVGVATIGAGAVIIGLSTAAGPAALITGAAGVGVLAYGANDVKVSFDQDAAHRRLQSILNSDFRLSCDSQSITVQSPTEKLILRSSLRRGEEVEDHMTIVNLRTQAQEHLRTNASPQAGKLLTDILKSCRSPSDASRIRSQLRSDTVRRNIARLLSEGASGNVVEEATRSNR